VSQAAGSSGVRGLVDDEAEEDDDMEGGFGMGQYSLGTQSQKPTAIDAMLAGKASVEELLEEAAARGADLTTQELAEELKGVVDELSEDEDDGVDATVLADIREAEDRKALRAIQKQVRDGFTSARRGAAGRAGGLRRLAGAAALSDVGSDDEDDEDRLERLEEEAEDRRDGYATNDDGGDDGGDDSDHDEDSGAKRPKLGFDLEDSEDDVDDADLEREMLEAQRARLGKHSVRFVSAVGWCHLQQSDVLLRLEQMRDLISVDMCVCPGW
jgi:hypothetical protein